MPYRLANDAGWVNEAQTYPNLQAAMDAGYDWCADNRNQQLDIHDAETGEHVETIMHISWAS